jgi:hypothetical protein
MKRAEKRKRKKKGPSPFKAEWHMRPKGLKALGRYLRGLRHEEGWRPLKEEL